MKIIENFHYSDWKNCIFVSNNKIKIVIVTDIGPRIIYFGANDGKNMFKEFKHDEGNTKIKDWVPYGGHRLWHAPESIPRSYYPDNSEVSYKIVKNTVILSQETEKTTGIKKEIKITLFEGNNFVKVVHRITNRNIWSIKAAPWAITMMKENTKAILPLDPFKNRKEDLLPVNSINLWPYTKITDPRITLYDKYIQLKQDPSFISRQKIGVAGRQCWIAGSNNEDLLIKIFDSQPFANYPDLGSNIEAYTDKDVIELETLGPLELIEPGNYLEHTEYWFYFHIKLNSNEDMFDMKLLPLIKKAKNILLKTENDS